MEQDHPSEIARALAIVGVTRGDRRSRRERRSLMERIRAWDPTVLEVCGAQDGTAICTLIGGHGGIDHIDQTREVRWLRW